MKNFTIAIDAIKFHAAKFSQANNDVRYYLNGVAIDREKNRVLSTDGHTLFFSNSDMIDNGGEIEAPADRPFVLGSGDGSKALKIKKPKRDQVTAIIQFNGQYFTAKYSTQSIDDLKNFSKDIDETFLQCSDIAATGKIIDGRFPDVDRVIPSRNQLINDNGVFLNCAYVKRVGEIGAALDLNNKYSGVKINFNASRGDSMVFDFSDDSFLIVMPMRDSDAVYRNELPRSRNDKKSA